MRQPKRTAISLAVAHMALFGTGAAYAQAPEPPKPAASSPTTVVVTGQRRALQTAQKIKQDAEEILDSVVAEEAGKLPDRSITEVLQRVVGVTVQRQRTIDIDAKHYSEEGSGIKVRGLSWGSSNLNGREIFSAGWPGRDLSWGAIPTELMAGVDIYKNPSAEQIEGAVSGLVNLRTALPFDYRGTKSYVSFGSTYEETTKKSSPSLSGLYSTQWDAESGRWGVLVDLSMNNSTYASESVELGAYFPRDNIVQGKTVWVPDGASWSNNVGKSDRVGFYGALQWKKNDKQSALTYFLSTSRDRDTGAGMYRSLSQYETPYDSVIDNPVVDDRGVLVAGRYRYPIGGLGANRWAEGGLGLGTTRSYNEHKTATGELAWNFKWAINDRWSLQNDLQWVHSKFDTIGREIQLGTFVPSMDLAVPGNGPLRIDFDQKSRDFLADPGNYYWNVVQPKLYQGDADMYAWKVDARFNFVDPVLRDLRFGYRVSRKTSEREAGVFAGDTGSTGWRSIAEPWAVTPTKVAGQLPNQADYGWQRGGSLAYLNDPRYQFPTEVYSFNNFHPAQFGHLPNVVFPTAAMAADYPGAYAKLLGDVKYQQCLDGVRDKGSGSCDPNAFFFDPTLKYGLNPNMTSRHTETTQAVYGNLRFGFDEWKVPVEGNVGARVVYSKVVAHGYTVFTPNYSDTTPPDLPRFGPINEKVDSSDSHVDVLPSMNLKFNLSGDNKLISRIAMARSMYRPGFNQLQESIKLKQEHNSSTNQVTYTGENTGNAKLKPLKSDNFDLSLEWYPRNGQALTAVAFYKDVKDIIYDSSYTRTYTSLAGNEQTFVITGPQNAARGKVAGIELAAETYLDHFDALKDKLPDWAKGFGFSANYTYIDSKKELYKTTGLNYCPANNAIGTDPVKLSGCDTNGLPFGDMPLEGLAKHAANFAFRYDRNGFSARLAYNWNSRSLKNVATFGNNGWQGTSADPARAGAKDTWWGLPLWQEAYGQWDGGMSYAFTDKFSLSLNVSNLNNVQVRETRQQAPGDMGKVWKYPGRSYFLSGRYEF